MSILEFIPYGRVEEFTKFLQDKYAILPDSIPDDFDQDKAIAEFLYPDHGDKDVEQHVAKDKPESDERKMRGLALSKIGKLKSDHIETVWFEAINKGTGGLIYVVDIISSTNEIERTTLKTKERSLKFLAIVTEVMHG